MSIYQQLQHQFPDLNFKDNYSLSSQTYFKIGGPAEVYIAISQPQTLIKVVKFCHQQQIKLTLLGGGSNVVVADEGISGLVIHLQHSLFKKLPQKIDGKQLVTVGAGLKTALLVKETVDLSLTGLEYFLGVPGTVGGAVFNNAHYLEDLISDHIYEVSVISPEGTIKKLSKEECDFGYDHSRFQTSQEVILEVTFALAAGSKEKSRELIKKATQYRAQTQPLGVPSSGCIFQNTPNTEQLKKMFPQFSNRKFVPAGFLIDQAGLKGTQIGDIEVSTKHAAFFINRGQGSAQDLKKLITLVKKEIKSKFDVDLKEEVFYLS